MVLEKVESLSGRTGLGRRETIVSAVIAEALKDPASGGELLAALLGERKATLDVLTTRSEASVNKERFDVVVLFRRDGRVFPLVIEVKVSAEEGIQQLERYVAGVREDEFRKTVENLLIDDGHAAHGSIADAEILYLTVAPESHAWSDVTYRTFKEWSDALDAVGPAGDTTGKGP